VPHQPHGGKCGDSLLHKSKADSQEYAQDLVPSKRSASVAYAVTAYSAPFSRIDSCSQKAIL
jgi:hypothetical protein